MTLRAFTILILATISVLSPSMAEKSEPINQSPQGGEAATVPKDFCSSFIDLAAERRNSRLIADLQRSREALAEIMRELDSKSQELKMLIATRKSLQDKVSDSLLKIYLQVEPEAAAQQLARLDPLTAAEILVRMSAKRSGEILTLMEAKRAASLVALLTVQAGQEKAQSQ
jgi:flagellar motility protein MotE (MotC chaperone)